jgi:hypothetical protein
MSDENIFLLVSQQIVNLLQPIRQALVNQQAFQAFLYEVGWSATTFPKEYSDLATAIDKVVSDLKALANDAAVDDVLNVIKDFIPIYQAVRNPPAVPGGVDSTVFLAEAGKHIFALTATRYIQHTFPALNQALEATGVITHVDQPTPTSRTAFVEPGFDFAKVGDFFKSPGSFLNFVLQWGTAALDADLLQSMLLEFMSALNLDASAEEVPPDLQAGYQPDPTTVAETMNGRTRIGLLEGFVAGTPFQLGLEVLNLPADGTSPPGIVIQPFVPSSIGQSFQLRDDLSIQVRAGSDVASTFGILIRPGVPIEVRYPFEPGKTPPSAGFGLGLTFTPAAPIILIGSANHSRLEVQGLQAAVNLDFEGIETEVGVSVIPQKLNLTIKSADGDGFVGTLLGAVDVTSTIDASVTWSARRGLRLGDGAGFELTVKPNKSIGPLTLQQLTIALKGGDDNGAPAIIAQVGLDVSAALGPVTASLSKVGAQLALGLQEGNVGPFNLDVGFKAPTGVGIAVNGGPVSGGGFISFDPDAGRYSGALALQVYSVAVKAFGVIDTKLPPGGPSFSFFIIISAEFQPIQLGFGFTLLGVGGLLGINRGLDATALEAAVKAGSIDNILFPKNPIKDAPTILADVESIFPATNGTYAFGPLARIGWGTPAIIDARVGIVLIFPGTKIALLGVITALLPPGASKALALVEIHMDIDGLLDFPKKHFEMDAELHDSQVRGFPISGEMAARMDWGTNPNFAVSLGGFNPHFTPPTGFPTLRRLSIDLGIKGNPSATLQGYMALTSNTAQVGAALSVSAHAGGANLSGGLAFDALFVFSPFSFDASLSGGVHVDFHGVGFGMHFDGEISGPAPWHLHGDVSVSVLWFSASVGFDLTLGGESKPQLPAIDIWAGSTPDANGNQDVPGLQSAVTAPGNWTGVLPPGGYQVVSITQNDSTHSRVDPLGKATFQQKVAPFALGISKFAGRSRAKSDVTTVTVQTLSVNAVAVAEKNISPVPDFFAPVQYQNVPDSQALSSPSYQQLQGGFSFSSDDIVFGTEKPQAIMMETVLVGSSATPTTYNIPDDDTMQAMTARSATGTGGLRKSNVDRFVDLTVTTLPFALATETYGLVFKTTLARFSGSASTDSAYALQADKLAALTPDVRATLQIVPAHEIPA